MSFQTLTNPTTKDTNWLRQVHDVVNNIMRGKLNNTASIALTANAATTTLQDPRIGGGTVVLLQPVSANAAAELGNGTLYFATPGNASVVINHANNAQTDRTFNYALIG